MDRPFIAIVGSADPSRKYDPPLKNEDAVPQAAEALGHALAEAGFGLIVYSANPEFIEADVVRGYVDSGAAKPQAIRVRYPLGGPGTESRFHQEDEHPELFHRQPDHHQFWQISFYPPRREQTTGQAMVLGMIAGLVAAILFVLAQLASNPNASNLSNGIPADLGRLIAFELIVGLIAGFTLEAVFDKIKRTDVLRTGPVDRTATPAR